jgi:hypothetical protein
MPTVPHVLKHTTDDENLKGFSKQYRKKTVSFIQKMNEKKVWVIEDGTAFTIMYPEDD